MTAVEIPTPDPRSFDEAARPFAEAISAHYAIKKMIGRGGMGIVYLARDRRLDRLVAVKTLPPHLAGDASVRERFLRETRMAGAMSHPNIVPIHGADEIDGHVFSSWVSSTANRWRRTCAHTESSSRRPWSRICATWPPRSRTRTSAAPSIATSRPRTF